MTERWLEDYVEGAVHELGEVSVDEDEIIAFAKLYDPQPIHIDRTFAAAGPFGGLIASGWQTCGLMMRLYATNYLSQASSLASPGLDELRWLRPVRPGDRLSVRVTVLESRASQSKPDRGVVRSLIEMFNQDRQPVLSMRAINMVARRPG